MLLLSNRVNIGDTNNGYGEQRIYSLALKIIIRTLKESYSFYAIILTADTTNLN